jgi:hypothetical protein
MNQPFVSSLKAELADLKERKVYKRLNHLA